MGWGATQPINNGETKTTSSKTYRMQSNKISQQQYGKALECQHQVIYKYFISSNHDVNIIRDQLYPCLSFLDIYLRTSETKQNWQEYNSTNPWRRYLFQVNYIKMITEATFHFLYKCHSTLCLWCLWCYDVNCKVLIIQMHIASFERRMREQMTPSYLRAQIISERNIFVWIYEI